MSLAKDIYYTACAALPMQLLKNIAPKTTLLPYHHTVSNEVLPHIIHLYEYKNVATFTNDLDYLLRHFNPVTPQEILDAVNKQTRLPANAFLLTFDDGFKEIHSVIAPILKAKGIPAIFFINPAFIDNKILFYRSKTSLLIHELLKKNDSNVIGLFGKELQVPNPTTENIISTLRSSKNFTDATVDLLADRIGYSFDNYLEKHTPFLTSVQVNELHGEGFTIGAHSWDHPYYGNLSSGEQVRQTTSSLEFVSTHFNENKKYFSFPYSDQGLPQSLFSELSGAGIDLLFGIQNQKEELNNRMLHRFNAERPYVPINKQIKGMLALMTVEKLMKKNKVIRN